MSPYVCNLAAVELCIIMLLYCLAEHASMDTSMAPLEALSRPRTHRFYRNQFNKAVMSASRGAEHGFHIPGPTVFRGPGLGTLNF